MPLSMSALITAALALGGEDAFAGKTGRVLRKASISIDRIRNRRIDAACLQACRIRRPHIEVIPAVPRGGVNETGAGIVADMLAGKERHRKRIVRCKSVQRMTAEKALQFIRRHVPKLLERGDACLP